VEASSPGSQDLLLVVVGALAALSLALSSLYRTGRVRYLSPRYTDPSQPAVSKNAPTALLTAGLMWLAAFGAIALASTGLGKLSLVACMGFAVVDAVLFIKPPSWAKPACLQEIDRRAGSAPASHGLEAFVLWTALIVISFGSLATAAWLLAN